jgi:hypothetical protein
MCDNRLFEMKFREEYMNDAMSQTYSSYMEYKNNMEEAKLRHLIHRKYIKVLGQFIENMYPGLKFDIFIIHRNPKEKHPAWYGNTYMELRIFDVIGSPMYNPSTFDPSYRTPHYDGYITAIDFFNNINDFIPEINKHLLISFSKLYQPHEDITRFNMDHIPDFECWDLYYKRVRIDKHYTLV